MDESANVMSLPEADGCRTNDDIAHETTSIKGKKRLLSITDEDVAATKKSRGRPAKQATSVHHKPRSIVKVAGKVAGKAEKHVLVDVGTQTETQLDSPIEWGDSQPVDTNLSSRIMSCIEALLLPISSHVNSLQKEMNEIKSAVTQLTTSLSANASVGSNGSSPSPSPNHSDVASDEDEQDADFIPAARASRKAKRRSSRKDRIDRRVDQPVMTTEPHTDLRRDVVAGMYVDLELKHRRARNIIVSGVPYTSDDFSYVTNLIAEEFELHYIPTVMCRRIGRMNDNRVQPLLVTMESKEDAAYLVANARLLRRSRDTLVKDNVYISADLTPAEAKAAYEIRCIRRQKNNRNQQSDQAVITQNDDDGRH